MAEPPPPRLPFPSSSSIGAAVAVAVAMGVGLRPHLYVLPLAPVSRDDVVWITRGAVTAPGWVRWVFASEHFVGFRPVTALSYTLDSLVGGFDIRAYRATDLLLHVGCVLLLGLVYRRLVPNLPTWGGLVAGGLLLLHPVSGLVVPHLARRGYPLATLLSLLGLVVLLGRPSRTRPFVAAALLGAGALANEAAYVAFGVAVLLIARSEPDRRSAVRAVAPSVVLAAILVIWRLALLGGAGGYAVERGDRWIPIALATWNGLLGLEVLRSEAAAIPDPAAWVLAIGLVGALVSGTVRPWDAVGRTSAVLWLWVVGLTAIYAPQGVFFPRQLYVPLAPFSLLVAIAVARASGERGIRRAAPLAAAAVLAALLARQSPVIRGTDPIQYASWRAHDGLVRDLATDLADLPADAVVEAVVPYHRRPEAEALRARDDERRIGGRQALLWVSALHDVRFGSATLVGIDARTHVSAGRLEERPDGPVIVLRPGVPVVSAGEAAIETTAHGTVIHPARNRPERGLPFLYFHDGLVGRLVPTELP